jgi:hypothetical protein
MIALKIALQIAVGIAALLTIYLDYKWYDKRKRQFRKGRNWLIAVMLAILTLSVFTTFLDDQERRTETETLRTELGNMKDSLSFIKKIGLELNEQIAPIIEIARKRYPDLPIEEAIEKLEMEIDSLEYKTIVLEKKENIRRAEEEKIEKLKRTPPDVDFSLESHNNKLYVVMTFKNSVPIKMRPFLSVIWDSEMNNLRGRGSWRSHVNYYDFYPNEDGVARFEYDDLNNKGLPLGEKVLGFRMIIRYYSIFYPEIKDEKLGEKLVELNLGLDPSDNKFKDIINK